MAYHARCAYGLSIHECVLRIWKILPQRKWCICETERKKMRRAQLPDMTMTPDMKSALFVLFMSVVFYGYFSSFIVVNW